MDCINMKYHKKFDFHENPANSEKKIHSYLTPVCVYANLLNLGYIFFTYLSNN